MTELEKRRLLNLKRTGRNILPKWEDRLEKIQEMVDCGSTLAVIGNRYGVTKERARQVLKQYKIKTSKTAKQDFRDEIARKLRIYRNIEKLEKIIEKLKGQL